MATYSGTTALALLTRQLSGTPALVTADFDLLMQIAASLAVDGVTVVYTSEALNGAVATGCEWKASQTADQYNIGGGGDAALTRDQWHTHWVAKAARFSSGIAGVDGPSARTRGGIASIPVVGTTVLP